MIEIIKEGTKRIVTCYNCGCVFSYEKEDIKQDIAYDEHYIAPGDYSIPSRFIKEYIKCPQCSKLITLKQEK